MNEDSDSAVTMEDILEHATADNWQEFMHMKRMHESEKVVHPAS